MASNKCLCIVLLSLVAHVWGWAHPPVVLGGGMVGGGRGVVRGYHRMVPGATLCLLTPAVGAGASLRVRVGREGTGGRHPLPEVLPTLEQVLSGQVATEVIPVDTRSALSGAGFLVSPTWRVRILAPGRFLLSRGRERLRLVVTLGQEGVNAHLTNAAGQVQEHHYLNLGYGLSSGAPEG